MPSLRCSRAVIAPLALGACLVAAPALAVWGPDSVLTLGAGGSIPLSWGAILPADGGDLYAIWHFPSASSAASGVSRVTAEGGLVFTKDQDYRTERQGTALDGSGGVLEVYSATASSVPTHTDIAYRRTGPGGTTEPASTNYWAAQTSVNDYAPTIATDPAGGAYIGWVISSGRYFLQRVTAAGTTVPGWSSRGRLMLPADSFSHPFAAPPLLPDGSGGVYMLAAEDLVRVWRVLADTTLAPGWPGVGLALSTIPDAYAGGLSPSDLALVPGPAGHAFAAWLEYDVTHSNSRVAVRSFDGAGNLDGPILAVTPFTSGISLLAAQSDGQGGALVFWLQSGVLNLAHVLATGTLGAGPIPAATPLNRWTLAAGRDGGFIAFWDDAAGIQAEWFLADGTPDPNEPENPRLVHPQGQSFVFPLAACADGDGGAYLLFDNGSHLPYQPSAQAQMMHVFRTGVLDVGGPPRPSRLALAVSPNPARRELVLDCVLTSEAPASIEVLDVTGRRIASRAIASARGAHHESIELPAGIAPGVYLARLAQGAASRVQRFAVVY